VAREAGSRSKLAVYAADPTIDAVGACVGPRGGRVGAVVEELKGEKMDIVNWSEDPAQFVAAALSPADVVSVTLIPGQKACRVVVPDDQLSLAIGKEGQNARLAARLTGYKIDIKSVSADRDDPLVLPEMLEEDDEDVILLDEENDEIVETAEAVETAETEEAVETAEVVEADEAPVAEE
jgi:N utilization substance protein A